MCGNTNKKKSDQDVDLKYVFSAINEIVKLAKSKKILITKSTVPVGTGDKIEKIIKKKKKNIEVISNPEFLREGEAIRDFRFPDRIVVGSNNSKIFKI